MSDLISRQEAIQIASGHCHHANIAKELAELTSAEPESHHWKTDYGYMWLCPECGLIVHSDFIKCARCGHRREQDDDMISRGAAFEAVGKVTETYLNNLTLIDKASVLKGLMSLPPAEPETKEIGYTDCANAMMKMWMDEVVTDGEYNRIIDKLNARWKDKRGGENAYANMDNCDM